MKKVYNLKPRELKVGLRVRSPRTTKLGTVSFVGPDNEDDVQVDVAWDDGSTLTTTHRWCDAELVVEAP